MTSLELTAITARIRENQAEIGRLIERVDFLAFATDRLAVAVEQRNALDLITTIELPMPEPSPLVSSPSSPGAAA